MPRRYKTPKWMKSDNAKETKAKARAAWFDSHVEVIGLSDDLNAKLAAKLKAKVVDDPR